MYYKVMLKLVCLVTVVMLSTSANAGLIEFDFENPNKLSTNELQYNINGIMLTITAFDSNGDAAKVHRNADGLGVTSGDNKRVDGGDYLVFQFNGPALTTFNDITIMFPTVLRWADNALQTNDEVSYEVLDISGSYVNTLSSNIESMNLGKSIGAGQEVMIGSNIGNGVRIAGINVSVQVPEPTTIAVFGLGLIGLGLRRRQK